MKRFAFIPVIAPMVVMIALGGCTAKLDDQDRALLTDTHAAAEQAKADAAQAAADARAARQEAEKADADANKAETDAMSVNTKSERMFRASQNK